MGPDLSGFFTRMYHFTVIFSQVLEGGSGLMEIFSLASISSQSFGLKLLSLPPENIGEGRSSKAGLSPTTLDACPRALPMEAAEMTAKAAMAKVWRRRNFIRCGFREKLETCVSGWPEKMTISLKNSADVNTTAVPLPQAIDALPSAAHHFAMTRATFPLEQNQPAVVGSFGSPADLQEAAAPCVRESCDLAEIRLD